MALFGTQLIITMVAACVLQKLGPYYSLARWLLCSSGLRRYRYPTDDKLREAAGLAKNGKKKGKHEEKTDNGFLIPKNTEFELDTAPVEHFEVIGFNFYTEYQWLVDFAVWTMVVYAITECYSWLVGPRDEVNLSMLWCLMVLGFAVRLLGRLTAVFFRSTDGSGELEICAVSGLAYFVVSMVILVTSNDLLELQLEQAYGSFNESATHFLRAHGLGSSGPASMFAFRLLLAVLSGFAGAILMFPGLRYTRMHRDCIRVSSENRALQLLYHVNFVMPLLNVLTWVRPLSRAYLTEKDMPSTGAPLLSDAWFDSLRLWLLVATVVLRMLLMPRHLQAYLNISQDKLDRIRKEAGRIRSTELQKRIVSVYYYVCVAALQFVTPLILSLYLALMYKSLGGYSWLGAAPVSDPELSPLPAPPTADQLGSPSHHVTFTLAAVKRVFTPGFYRGLLGYLTWWTSFVMFTSSVVGSSLLGYT
ncbi:Transmembrane protein 161B [Amphibalanus amphitrite]|uniref:Transmembrane protein 161B n=1 Tax=Amphibalanus amphitrite TaxID=1232801 RepID=A0A6A4VXJ1_AMPAM|nr:transmembrane protein 161B-like [Amphibalanus amphitrite]XP_043193956.1 transmembrane protein 161B-like [Amphibalanus amphitrite]XP_043193958.1 transmembrane protein 161B-like [Amphibalanus amphitrite]XP_043193959.1 transmembrane protein 161B-like [Amphibalanus amphitrite]KAF0296314.1 Transmembrane protein 161B [Amphibalanus amphitrite]